MILGENNEKMSKSRGNVINPDEVVESLGADTLRMYEMFMGDFEKAAPWSNSSMRGCKRFLDRVFALLDLVVDGDGYSAELEATVHRTIKKVSEDIEGLKFNTAIAAMMSLVNEIYAKKSVTKGELKTLLQLLNPFAPHMTEEMWEIMKFGGEIAYSAWPVFDEAKCVDDVIEIAVQINGKLKGRITIPADADEKTALDAAKSDEKVANELNGKTVIKEIYVKGKIVNIVVR